MRLLIVVAVALAGCYDPSIDDCQFACSAARDCPDGTDCVSGACRTSTGVCATDGCANAPAPPSGCASPFALVDGCGVVCASESRSHDEVNAACGPTWRAAILDATVELDAVPVTTGRYWVGAERVGGVFQWFSGAPVDPTAWDAGQPMGGGGCVYLDGATRRLNSDKPCDANQGYICTFPATN